MVHGKLMLTKNVTIQTIISEFDLKTEAISNAPPEFPFAEQPSEIYEAEYFRVEKINRER